MSHPRHGVIDESKNTKESKDVHCHVSYQLDTLYSTSSSSLDYALTFAGDKVKNVLNKSIHRVHTSVKAQNFYYYCLKRIG